MKNKRFVLISLLLFSMVLILSSCGTKQEVLTISGINILNDNDEAIAADEDGVIRLQEGTVEVYFSGNVNKISFYAVTADSNGDNQAELLAEGAVAEDEGRALFEWDVPDNFEGYIWIVLNDDQSSWEAGAYRAISSVGVEGGAHAVFSCIYEGEPLRIMLYKPVDQSAQGIWAVKSYQDADGIHDYEFEPQPYIDTVETLYEILQSTANLTGGDPALTDPTNVALQYLLDEFEFEPEEYEVRAQSDDIYR